jgi:hypothetical protein
MHISPIHNGESLVVLTPFLVLVDIMTLAFIANALVIAAKVDPATTIVNSVIGIASAATPGNTAVLGLALVDVVTLAFVTNALVIAAEVDSTAAEVDSTAAVVDGVIRIAGAAGTWNVAVLPFGIAVVVVKGAWVIIWAKGHD